MSLFGKQKKSELQAATEFVMFMCKHVQAQWPSLCSSLTSFEPQFAKLGQDNIASYEFTLAAIAIQMQALPNLLRADQSARIRSHVMECLTTDEVGDYPYNALAEYDAAWDRSVAQAEIPLGAVASVLYDKLGLTSSVPIGQTILKNPVLLTVLGATIFEVGGGWWKNYSDQHQIVT
jgi:hypothetical protein